MDKLEPRLMFVKPRTMSSSSGIRNPLPVFIVSSYMHALFPSISTYIQLYIHTPVQMPVYPTGGATVNYCVILACLNSPQQWDLCPFLSLAESAASLRTHLKPAVPKRPAGALPPQKVGSGAAHVFSSPPSISSAERVRPRSHDCTAEVKPPSFTCDYHVYKIDAF